MTSSHLFGITNDSEVVKLENSKEIAIVSSPQGVGQLAALLGSGRDYGCWLTYHVQDKPSGIAAALTCVPMSGQAESIAVILGDNIFLPFPNLITVLNVQSRCFLHMMPKEQLREFGVPRFDANGIANIIEKPSVPPSDYAVTGLYMFGQDLPKNLKQLSLGLRGEYEITDLLNGYAKRESLIYAFIDGFWGDAGTPEGLARCAAACKKWSENK
mgnify:CR=1 FL=1